MKIVENYMAYLEEKKFCGELLITIKDGRPVKMVQNKIAPRPPKASSTKKSYQGLRNVRGES